MKLLQAMKEALQVILVLVGIVVFFSTLFAGIEILSDGNPLVGIGLLLLVFFIGLTTIIYVEKQANN